MQHLYDELPMYARKLVLPDDQDDDRAAHSAARVNNDSAKQFLEWLERDPGSRVDPPPEPGEKDWWRIIINGSEVRVYSEDQREMVLGTVKNRYWDEGVKYQVRIGQEISNFTDENIQQAGSNFDYELWNPSIDRTAEFYINVDGY